jgi:hypothetical protein
MALGLGVIDDTTQYRPTAPAIPSRVFVNLFGPRLGSGRNDATACRVFTIAPDDRPSRRCVADFDTPSPAKLHERQPLPDDPGRRCVGNAPPCHPLRVAALGRGLGRGSTRHQIAPRTFRILAHFVAAVVATLLTLRLVGLLFDTVGMPATQQQTHACTAGLTRGTS